MLLIVCEIRHMSTAVLHLNTLLENFGSHSSTNIKMLCFTLFIAALITTIYGQSSQPFIWPLPAQYTVDESSSYNVAYDFNFASNVKSDILDSAFDRYQKIIFHHYPQTPNPSNAINALTITVASSSDYLQNDTDESYNLTISSGSAKLSSNTIYGALRGIETFSQTVIYNFDLGYYQTYSVQISDKPRFSYRGVLLDCSRHFQTVSSLFRLLDAMSYAKFNVFHWHLTDDQSIPYQSVKYPLFWNDAWSNYERYTQGDMQAVVQYAKYRGIRVIPEFDMPGHATSWCIGYPLACPFNSTNGIDPKTNNTCRYPLNPAVNFTFELIEGLISEAYDPANNLFFDNFVHLGGDEVNTYCWTEDPTIVAWMKENNFGTTEANQYFMQTVHNIAAKYNRTTIQWDDVYGMEIAKDTIIEAYYHDDVTQLVDAGYRSIASPEPSWYLDHLSTTWEQFYGYEPCVNLTTDAICDEMVLGGEMSMWGESVDDSDMDQTIWPRSAAGAERLWSQRSQTDGNENNAHHRLEYFRCLLNTRGIAAAPTNNAQARQPPNGYASCYYQRRR